MIDIKVELTLAYFVCIHIYQRKIFNANNAPSIFITKLYDGCVVTLDADAVNHGATEVGDKDPKGTVLCPQLSTVVRFLISL